MLTEKGYIRRTYAEILEAKILKAKELFGEDIDTSDLTPLGKYIRINAYDQAETEEEAEAIYYSIFPNTAAGTSLDRLCTFVGISRNPATPAQYNVAVTGTVGFVVPFGFLVGTESDVQFYVTADTPIGEDGTCIVAVECTEAGTTGNVNSDEITVIVNPDADVLTVLGESCLSVGTDEETDVSLRKRFAAARTGLGSCNESAIEAALMRIETVTSASVIANETDSTDKSGRPPHSFECYVTGGEDHHEEIAATIFDKKPLGIKTYGSIAQTITDDGGNAHTINFSHTANVDVTVNVKIKISASYEAENGTQEIINNLQQHINYLGVGNSVVHSSLYGKIHAVTGVEDVTEILLNGSESNVEINKYSTARCGNVTVEVVV